MNNTMNNDEATRGVGDGGESVGDGGELVVDGGEVVETAEVKFVPLEEDDNDFGVFSGGEESYYSDVEPMPVVLEEEVQIEDEGDVVVLNDDEGVEKLEDEDDVVWNGGDRRMMNRVAEDLERDDGGREERFLRDQRFKIARFWREQVDAYEGRILELEKRLGTVSNGFKAAKRIAEEETEEVERLRRLYMNKISEAERLRETVADMVSRNCELEEKDRVRKRNNKRTVQGLRKDLEDERKRSRNLEEELKVTRTRLLRFTRRSVPRVARRVIRRVDSYEDGEESSISVDRTTSDEDNEDCRVNKLIKIMDDF